MTKKHKKTNKTEKAKRQRQEIDDFAYKVKDLAEGYRFDGVVIVPINFNSTCAVVITGKDGDDSTKSMQRLAKTAVLSITKKCLADSDDFGKAVASLDQRVPLRKFVRAMEKKGLFKKDAVEMTYKCKIALAEELDQLGFNPSTDIDHTILIRALNKIAGHPLNNDEIETVVDGYKEIFNDFCR